MTKTTKSLLRYFAAPFPSGKGFSPYRSPGPSVHLPVLLSFGLIGYLLFYPWAWMWAPIAILSFVGLYIGRDLAIAAHYSPPITLVIWGAAAAEFIVLPRHIGEIRNFLSVLPQTAHAVISFWILGVILVLFVVRLKFHLSDNR